MKMLSPLSAVVCFLPATLHGSEGAAVAGNAQVRKIMETYAGRGTLADDTPLTPPAEALHRFTLRPGLELDLMASEPQVEQPLYINWDSQGRLWVVQYRQYQFPAGLKVVSYDQHLRAQFDQVPQPPPLGVRGEDKITVFTDTDADGFLDRHEDMITGLNIASAALPGAGAVWVLNPPYLLRYPDADGDGKPDAPPEVALRGFGIEDTHSVANSLQWGVDGWLYGAHGSTCTGNVSSDAVKNVRFEGQCIWRYHPGSKMFEVYAEGGGNTFSLDIDAKGRVFSGTNGGGTRGMHYEQGSYGVKSWGKHGPLTNPHALGWFEHMKHEGDSRRFPQAFVLYEGGLLGEGFEDHIIAPNALANLVYVSRRVSDGSTFRTIDEADLLSTPDRWFRPVDAKVGPDGALYLADWYDTRLSHVRPVDDWHKTSGRIYRVRPRGGAPTLKAFNLHTASAVELVEFISHKNRWFRRQAALEIGWRRLNEAAPALLSKARSHSDPYALDALFALDMLDAVGPALASELLAHTDPYVRRWVVKIIGEKGRLWSECAPALASLAIAEKHLEVQAQLLASAKRLSAEMGLPLLHVCTAVNPASESRLPLLAWWALESKCQFEREALAAFLRSSPELLNASVFENFLLRRLGQRLATGGGHADLEFCASILKVISEENARQKFVSGVLAAFEGGELPQMPLELRKMVEARLCAQEGGELVAELRAAGTADVIQAALKRVAKVDAPAGERIALVKALCETGHRESVPVLLSMAGAASTSGGLKRAILDHLARFSDDSIPRTILASYEAKFSGDKSVRESALRLLSGRREWALLLMEALDAWRVPVKHITPDVLAILGQHHDAVLAEGISRHWRGASGGRSLDVKAAEARRLRGVLAAGAGDPVKGRVHFQNRCAACHKLFGEGGNVGPELTG